MKYIIVILIFITHYESLSNESVYDLRNNRIDIDLLAKPTYLLLYHWKNCAKCFTEIENSINEIDSSANIIIIVRCENKVLTRKQIVAILKELVQCRTIFFDQIEDDYNMFYPPSTDIGLFGKYQIYITPALIYCNGEKKIVLKNEDLFGKWNNPKALKKLLKID